MSTHPQTSQIVNQTALAVTRAAAVATQATINANYDVEFDAPLRLYASNPSDTKLNIGASQVSGADGTGRSVPPQNGTVSTWAVTTIDFSSAAVAGGGTVTRDGSAFSLPTITATHFLRIAFVFTATGTVDCTASDGTAATKGALPNVGTLFAKLSGIPLGWIDLVALTGGSTYKTADSAGTSVLIEPSVAGTAQIVKFGAGASASTGDSSFKLQSVVSDVATIKGGAIIMDDGTILATYNGSLYYADITATLTTLLATPGNGTEYYLAVDLSTLTAETTDLNGVKVRQITSTNLALITVPPTGESHVRYVPFAAVQGIASNHYSSSLFGTLPLRRHGNVSGAPEKNYIAPSSSAAGWTASGAGITVANTNTGSECPRQFTTLQGIKITPVSSTDYVFYRFTIDPADVGVKLKLQFAQKPVAGYTSGDLKVDVYTNTVSDYSGTFTRLALSTDVSAVSAIPNLTGTFRTTFDAPATPIFYEIRIGRVAGTTALVISDVVVGPGVVIQGAALSGWTAYTPTGTWSANTGTWTGEWRREGDALRVRAMVPTTGAPTGNFTLNLPTGYTINLTALPSPSVGSLYPIMGSAVAFAGTGTLTTGYPAYFTATSIACYGGSTAIWSSGAPVTFANNGFVSVDFVVPVNEFAGNGVINVVQNDIQYLSNSNTSTSASDTSTFTYGPAGQAVVAISSTGVWVKKRVQLALGAWGATMGTPIVKVSPDGKLWLNAADVFPATQVGSKLYGIDIQVIAANATQIDVAFGGDGANTSTAWSAETSWFWRVDVAQANQAIGYGAATLTSLGLVRIQPPTQQIFTSGSGTYIPTSSSVSWIRVRAVGGGSGGAAGSGTGGTGAVGSAGTATTFGTALISAGGAAAQLSFVSGCAGGTSSLGSAIGIALTGANGSPMIFNQQAANILNNSQWTGGAAGSSPFGGAGTPGTQGVAGAIAAQANTGSGGGGGGSGFSGSVTYSGGGGGGAGGFVDAIISPVSASYAYTVGAGGAGGTSAGGGGAGGSGGAGAAGIIIVEEHYY